MEFTTTEKGQRKVLRNGYMYVFQKTLANDVSSWECVLRRRGDCKARIKLSERDDFIGQTNEHTHPPCQTNCEVAKVKAGIKRRAEGTNDTSQQILSAELSAISESVAVNLPSMEVLRRNVRAARQERNMPPLPINRAAIPVLPQQYQQTENGQQFLLFDSGVGDAERILIFLSQQGLEFLSNSEHWYADGTFKVCPEVFFSSIHGTRATGWENFSLCVWFASQ